MNVQFYENFFLGDDMSVMSSQLVSVASRPVK